MCVCVRSLWMRRAANRPSAWQAALSTGVSETWGPSTSQSNTSWVHTLHPLHGHWRHPTPSSKGRQLSQGPNNSQRVHTCSDSRALQHSHIHTNALHVNTTLNTRAYGVHNAHVWAFVPTCLPVRKQRQWCKYTQKHTQASVSSH